MAPEQSDEAHEVGPEADLYSLGKTLYFLATGEPPHSITLDRLPSRLRGIVDKCTKIGPEDRYRTVSELLAVLRAKSDESDGAPELLEGECPSCGYRNPPDARTCGRCRESLLRKCPSPDCEREVQAWAKYCPYCEVEIVVERRVRELLVRAARELEEGRPRRAGGSVEEALALSPEHADAAELRSGTDEALELVVELRGRARRLMNEERYEEAEKPLAEGHALDADEEWFPANLKSLPEHIRERDARRALESGRDALAEHRPREAGRHLGRALELAPEGKQARQLLSECEKRLETVEALLAELDEHEEAGEIDLALSVSAQILALDRDTPGVALRRTDIRARLASAERLLSLGQEAVCELDWGRAIKHLSSSLELWPAQAEARQALVDAQARQEQFQELLDAARELGSEKRISEALRQLDLALEVGDSPGARKLRQRLERRAREARQVVDHGQEATEQRQWRRASSMLEKACRIDIRAVDEDLLGVVRTNAQEVEKAAAKSRKRLSVGEFDEAAAEASAGLRLGSDPELDALAKEAGQKARELDRLWSEAERAERFGIARALELWRKVRELKPFRDDVRHRIESLMARSQEALPKLQEAENWVRKKRWHKAQTSAREAWALDPGLPRAQEIIERARTAIRSRRARMGLAALLVVVVAATGVHQARRASQYKNAMVDANKALEASDHPAALKNAQNALRHRPGDAEALGLARESAASLLLAGLRSLTAGPNAVFEIPVEGTDGHGNPIRQGTDQASGLPLAIRHRQSGMHLVFVPAGEFMMGSNDGSDDERPAHKVSFTEPFYLGKYEVTQAEWRTVMGDSPRLFKGDKNLAESVSWDDCQELVMKLNEGVGSSAFSVTSAERALVGPEAQTRREARTKSLSFALPTEAQWEYACQAGSDKKYCFGDSVAELGEYAWFCGNSEDSGWRDPVGTRKPNTWGLYDMHGNMLEWCEDWYADYPDSEVTDPTGPQEGSHRVRRGGGWVYGAECCRSACRVRSAPDAIFTGGCRLLLRSVVE